MALIPYGNGTVEWSRVVAAKVRGGERSEATLFVDLFEERLTEILVGVPYVQGVIEQLGGKQRRFRRVGEGSGGAFYYDGARACQIVVPPPGHGKILFDLGGGQSVKLEVPGDYLRVIVDGLGVAGGS